MALDFHRLPTNEYLFSIDDRSLESLQVIFETFTHWTGLVIDPYGDLRLTVENQQTLITIIEKYIAATDLNKDKVQTATVLEFGGLLRFFCRQNMDLQLKGD